MDQRILIVDNEPNFLRLMSSTLMEDGYEVDVARDGTEGLNIIDNQVFDLVLSELSMPKMSGLQGMRKRKSAEKSEVLSSSCQNKWNLRSNRYIGSKMETSPKGRRTMTNRHFLVGEESRVHQIGRG